MDLWGYEAVSLTAVIVVGATVVTTAAIIAVTQNESYQEAIGEASEKINEKIQKTKEKMKTLFSKGKKERDKEGNPIPLENQKQSPLGKGANGGPEDVGDPGDFGGPDFKPPKEPNFKEITAIVLAGTTIVGNDVKEFVDKVGNSPNKGYKNEKNK